MIDESVLLQNGATYKEIKKGEFIFLEGTSCNYYFQLKEGVVSWLNFSEDGKVFIQSIVEKGDSFGILPLFDDAPYAASAVAETDCIVLKLPKQKFKKIITDCPKTLFLFTQTLAKILRNKLYFLKEVACHNPEHKVLEVLKYYREKTQHETNEPFRVFLTRMQIAEMTGLRVETVIRVIKRLSNKGNLNITKGKIYLLNNDSNRELTKQ